jgi:hypothetical protein
MLPNFLIIGAQKSGSTFFLKCLAEHPDVFMPPGEVRFFEDPDYGDGDIRRLESLFRNVKQEKALGIKRPGYLSRAEVAARIHQHIPNAKLIAILRNPVDRAISAYFHLMKCGFIPVRPLEDGMTRILDGEYQKTHVKAAEILDFGLYHRHLTRYLDYFDRSQMLILPFETIKVDPLDVVQQAYRFIGVSDTYVPIALTRQARHNPNPGVYSLTRLRILNLRNPFMYTYNADRTRRTSKRRPSAVDRAVSKMVNTADRYVLARMAGAAQPEASDALRQRLYQTYAEDIDRLEALLDRPLNSWKPAETRRASSG